MMGQKPQQCFLVPIIPGTDGVQKMSKSLDNYIAIEEPPNDMYGKLMSIPDDLIMDYLTLLTDIPDDELKEMALSIEAQSANPMDVKKRLAREIVSQFHSEKAATEAEANFQRVVQKRDIPEEIPEVRASFSDLKKMANSAALASLGLVSSRAEAKRLINQNAVEVNGQKATEDSPHIASASGSVIKIGRRKFVRIVNEDSPL
jgi:tyrosyl-tRNA synthetase